MQHDDTPELVLIARELRKIARQHLDYTQSIWRVVYFSAVAAFCAAVAASLTVFAF